MESKSSIIDEKIIKLKQEILELEKKKAKQNNYGEDKKSEHYCNRCRKNFDTYRGLERHGWEIHPSNEYERAWANKDWSTWKGSSYYEDDPYY